MTRGGHGGSTRAKAWRDGNKDTKHREECEALGIFPLVWPSYMRKLTDDVRATLLQPTNEDIDRATRPFLERWLRTVGEKTNGLLVGALRRRILEIQRELRQPGDYMFKPRTPELLPWRLTRDAFEEVDRRIVSMVFPQHTERVTKNGKSCFRLGAATCKTSKKMIMLLYILPTVLRDYVQAFRRGLRFIVLAIRMIDGQVYSFNKCQRLNVEPGSRCFHPEYTPMIRSFLARGLSMMTGSVPPSTLIPCLHILGHYGDDADLFAILRW